MTVNLSQRAGFAEELSVTMPDIDAEFDGTLDFNPVIIIFDNQSNGTVEISANGILWKTFVSDEALVLDLRAAHGIASNYTFDIGTTFTATGAGAGDFKISYIYARN